MMEFDGEFESEHSPDRLWAYFTDPDVLAECAPGCKEMTLVEPHRIEAVVAVGVGSVKPEFDVEAIVTTCETPTTLEMDVDGDANRTAFDAATTMTLTETDEGGTLATWHAETDVSGLVASMGQRALRSVTDRLVTDFFSDVEAMAEEGVPAESKMQARSSAADAD